MQRRTFVGGVFAGVTAAAPRARAVQAGGIPKRKFGKTGIELTVIGQAAGRLELAGYEDAVAIVRRAYDLGINYFDNARAYWKGRSEEVFGAVLPPFRKDVFITSKSAMRTRAEAEADLHQSLKALKTDYVDLWQIHSVMEMEEAERIFAPGGAIEAFEAARKAGKCRFIGVTSHHDPHVLAEMLKRYDKFDTIFMPLNIADPGYLSFEKLTLPSAVAQGLGIQVMKSLAVAKLLGSFSLRDCLGYVLSLPVHCLALGCTTVGQLEDDVRAAQQFRPFTEEHMNALRKRADRLKGPGLENWKRNVETAGIASAGYVGG